MPESFGLAGVATLDGNLNPIEATANIATFDVVRKIGHKVGTTHFMRIIVSFTILSFFMLLWFLCA